MSSQITTRHEGTRQNCVISRKVSGCQGEMNVGEAQEIFRAGKLFRMIRGWQRHGIM